MKTNKILIVEDVESERDLLKTILKKNGYDITTAENGKAALDVFKKVDFAVVITDLKMPVMDGHELINHLVGIKEEPVILVLTAEDDSKVIIDIMKKGVFDYVIKPVKADDLLMKIERALNVSEFKRVNKVVEKEKVVRIEQQLEWYKWMEKMKGSLSSTQTDKSLFSNINRSFNQGAGFGGLLTLLNLISSTAKKKGDHYEVSEGIFEMINSNIKMTDKAISIFSDIDWIMVNDLNLKKISCLDIYNLISEINQKDAEYIVINNNSIKTSDAPPSFKKSFIEINEKYFRKAIHEIFVNAMKYSIADSIIYVILRIEEGNLNLSVVNEPIPLEKDVKGVPMEYENIVFDPFYRMSKLVFDSYDTMDFGLGLTMVEKIIHRHNGKISLFNIMDYSDIQKEPVLKVNCNIILPLVN
ncbi:response regulator [Spirochaetota bacterium]